MTGLKGPLAVGIAAMAVTLLFWAAAPRTWLVNESNDYDTFYEPAGREIAAGHDPESPDGGEVMIFAFPLCNVGGSGRLVSARASRRLECARR